MHEQLWDTERGMVCLYGLHLVRETALGAFLDLEDGKVERAERALRNVLTFQYSPAVDPRWAGTFKTHAAQPDAGSRNNDGQLRDRLWQDYDPNWRQFLGVILWSIERLHGHVLPADLRAMMHQAISVAAQLEPTERISADYTNIALLHTFLGDATGMSSELGARVSAQVRRDGDIAEYNSPTYDAISLFASCLLAQYSTSSVHRALGILVIERLCARLGILWHPELGIQAGPYTRAYGLDPRKYVSLMSVLMTAIDVRAAGPSHLDNTTTHVHDLYFLPLFLRVCGSLRKYFTALPITTARRHEQRYEKTVATSIIEPDMVLGWESGRRSQFALDQYAPFTMYTADSFLGLRTRADTDWVDIFERQPYVYEVHMARRGGNPAPHDNAALTVVASQAPIIHGDEMLFGRITLQFPGIVIEVRLPR